MNFIQDFKNYVKTHDSTGEISRFNIQKNFIEIELRLNQKTINAEIHELYIYSDDMDFQTSGVSLWDDVEEMKEKLISIPSI